MTDEVDEAQQKAEDEVRRGVAAAQARAQQPGTLHCCDCGNEIPAPRRKANPNARRCIDCQEGYESGTPFRKG